VKNEFSIQPSFDSFQIVKLKFLCRIEMLTEDSVLVVQVCMWIEVFRLAKAV